MKILRDPELKQMSTLKMGGQGTVALYPFQESHLDEIGRNWMRWGKQLLSLGRGSNILFTEGRKDLVLIRWQGQGSPRIISQGREKVRIRVDGGYSLPGLLGWSAGSGLSGLEELAGIPGTVGGAVAMNAGSHDLEICSLVSSIDIWTPEQGVINLKSEDLQCGYRFFAPRSENGWFLILAAELNLVPHTPPLVRDKIKRFYLRKRRMQPVLAATAGCVFRNPQEGDPAGKLLEQAGFRGKHRGNVGFSGKHANFLVNLGGGTSTQALELIQEARETVYNMFGHTLEMEIQVV